MIRLSKANLHPAKSWRGNLTTPLGQSTVWRTNEGFTSVSKNDNKNKYSSNNNDDNDNNHSHSHSNSHSNSYSTDSITKLDNQSKILNIDFNSLKKEIIDVKYNSKYGTYWDLLQVFLSLVSCALYVSETYYSSYKDVRRYFIIEQIMTQFFAIDFILNWFVSVRTSSYFISPMTWVDIITILPSYLIYLQNAPDLSSLRFARILRMVRILRTFKLLGGLSGIKRQVVTICLLLLSLTFLAAGIYNLCENDYNQLSYECKFINSNTYFEPSCDKSYPSYNDPNCDCHKYNCVARYYQGDNEGKPSLIRCTTMTFLESYYFTVVTITSVGYGDLSPSNLVSRIVTLLYIITAFVMIPMQVNKLEQLIEMHSPYRTIFKPHPQENHIILCGHVNDKQKLGRVFREFFHPDRRIDRDIEINICILCPTEPTEEVKDLLSSPLFDNRVSYIIGSALNMEDLQKARADIAAAMFFLSNIEVDEEDALLDDAATVLRTLSVNNFNSNLDCFVQVLRSQERDLLKDSNAELILCYDEYKTTLQARNSICPGLATMVENLFHTFGSVKTKDTKILPTSSSSSSALSSKVSNEWISEYTYGARMELYYIPIDMAFFSLLGYSFALLAEAIYLEFECLLVGVCNVNEYSTHFNPRQYERKKYKSAESYFQSYSVGILIAPNNSIANAIKYAMTDAIQIEKMIDNLYIAENQFIIRRAPDEVTPSQPPVGTFLSASTRALSVRRSVRGVDLQELNTDDLKSLRKIQNGLENEFSSRKNLMYTGEMSAAESGMESDSSEENDDDFLGYIEHVEELAPTGSRRVGIYDSFLSQSIQYVKSESSDISLSQPTSNVGNLTSSSNEDSFNVNVNTLTLTPQNLANASSALNAFTPNKRRQSTAHPIDHSLEELDQHPDLKGLRPYGLVSLKSIQNMKKAASSRKMSTLRSFRANVAKKNKTKSLKQAASLVKTLNKLNGKGGTTGGGGGGGFAALVKAAAAAQPTPDNLVPKPASIVTALQQSRMTKQTTKLSLLDAAKLMKAKEAIESKENEQSSTSASTLASTSTLTLPPIQQPVSTIDKKLQAIENSTLLLTEPEKTIAQEVAKFQAQKEERRSFRRVLSTRTSTVISTDKIETVPTPITAIGINSVINSNNNNNVTNTIISNNNTINNTEKDKDNNNKDKNENDPNAVSEITIDPKEGIIAIKKQNSVITKQLSRSQSKVVARAQSRGVPTKQLSRADSQVGEIVNVATLERNAMGRKSIAQLGFGRPRRQSVDSGLSNLKNEEVVKGRTSEEIEDAASLKNHIIVFGCMDHISIFILELRRKLLSDHDYRPILIVSPQEPRKWYQIRLKYNDVFLLTSTVTSAQDLTLMNIRDAHALVLLAHRQAISVDETSNVDSETLFLYLTIEKLVPKHVFFTVELSRPNNMGVLNSVIVRRNRMEKNTAQPKNTSHASIWGDDTVTGLSLKLRGSHKFRGSVDIGGMMNRLQSEKSMEEKSIIKLASRRANVFNVPDLSNAPTRGLSISSMISSNPALHSKNQAARRKIRANRKIHTIDFWDVDDTHHVLPVFASGKAVCPTAFDSILCQSFFGILTSQLCEKLICGQETQTFFQFSIPKPFYGRKYVDLLRSCVSRCLLPFGLYRSPLPKNGAILPYIFTNPPMETVLAGQDKIILFGNPQNAAKVFEQFEVPLVRQDGKMALGIQVSVASMQDKRKSITQTERKLGPVLNPIVRPSEYKPMGARKKSVNQDIKQTQEKPFEEIKQLPPVITTSSQYVPRGAVKIHPISSPLKNDNINNDSNNSINSLNNNNNSNNNNNNNNNNISNNISNVSNVNNPNHISGLVSERKLDLYEPRKTSNSISSRVEMKNISKSPRYDTTVHTEEKIE